MLHTIAKEAESNKVCFRNQSSSKVHSSFQRPKQPSLLLQPHPFILPQVSQLPPNQVSQFIGVSDFDPINDLI